MNWTTTQGESTDSVLAELLDELTSKFNAGEPIDPADYERRLPEHADQIRKLIGALEAMGQLGRLPPVVDKAGGGVGYEQDRGRLGDFRIVREIGRGGMGVVYEAEQISLGRRVALKVLPFAAMLDDRQLERFKNEARAAASLKHPNIVGIHSVGCERAVHFYAMEYVEGQTLAEIIDRLRVSPTAERLRTQDARPHHGDGEPASHGVGTSIEPSDHGRRETSQPAPDVPHGDPLAETRLDVQAGISTARSNRSPDFFRSVGRLGIQAAEALEHAHQSGVVHRDIKPSNLILDRRGNLWISDFGLAQTQAGSNITMTGDVLGTLRYMSPEQAQGKRRILDHHTDIYSLGVTLYELLTLQPPFEVDDCHELIHRIIDGNPHPLRGRNPSIPRDLETIVLKAMAAEPEARYETAQALADDLRRFVELEPIRARCPGLVDRAAKWSRRHRPAVFSAAGVVSIAMMVAAGAGYSRHQQRLRVERAVDGHIAAAHAFLQAEDFSAAEREVAQARTQLEFNASRASSYRLAVGDLTKQVAAKTWAQEQRRQFQELRQQVHADVYHLDDTTRRRTLQRCRAALALYRVLDDDRWREQPEFEQLPSQQQNTLQQDIAELLFTLARLEVRAVSLTPAAQRARYRTWRYQWVIPANKEPEPALRKTAHQHALDALARIEKSWRPIPGVYLWMADSLRELGQPTRADEAISRANALRPTTGLDYYVLAEYQAHRKRFDEALENYSLALRRDPDHYLSLLAAGVTLARLDRYEAAEAMLTGAIALNRRTTLAYVQRGNCCLRQAKQTLSQADFAKALELDSELTKAYSDRANEYFSSCDWEEAIANCTQAIRLDPIYAEAYKCRAVAYRRLGKWDESIADCTEAICINPTAQLYVERAAAELEKGDRERAFSDANMAVQIDPKSARAYNARASVYSEKRLYEKAIADLNEALRLDPDDVYIRFNQAKDYLDAKRVDEAIAEYTEVIRRAPAWHYPHFARGLVYRDLKEMDKAIADFSEAIRLLPSADYYRSRAMSLRTKGEIVKALEDFTEAIRINPSDATAYRERAKSWQLKGDFKQAASDVQKLVELASEDAQACNDVAWFLATCPDARLRDGQRAVELAERAVKLSPTGTYRNTLGVAQYRLGNYKAAIESLGKSMRLGSGGNAFDWFFLAMAQWQLGHKDEARNWYDKAVEWTEKHEPKNEELRRFQMEAAELLGLTDESSAGKGKAENVTK